MAISIFGFIREGPNLKLGGVRCFFWHVILVICNTMLMVIVLKTNKYLNVQECKDFHQAKDGDGWVEQSFQPVLFGMLRKVNAKLFQPLIFFLQSFFSGNKNDVSVWHCF